MRNYLIQYTLRADNEDFNFLIHKIPSPLAPARGFTITDAHIFVKERILWGCCVYIEGIT